MTIELCFICKLGIDIKKEDFCKISDYKKGKHLKSIYSHVNCWREHLSNKGIMKKMMAGALQTTARADKMLKEAGY